MPFVIQCPQCGQNLKVPDNLAGKKVRCSKCANSFLAEAVTGTPPASVPPPPQPQEEDLGDAGSEERRSRRGGSGGRPGRGGMLLTLGIISIVLALVTWICPCIPLVGIFIAPIVPVIGLGLGVPALLLGRSDLARIKAGEIARESQGTTQGGFICGIIGTVLNALMLLCACVVIIAGFVGMGLPAFMNVSKAAGGGPVRRSNDLPAPKLSQYMPARIALR